MANIKDVAKLAGVSISTVSRVVNKSTGVTEKKSNAVLRAMQELNYQPNSFAKALVCNKSNLLGLVVSDLSDPFFGHFLQAVESISRKNSKQILVRSGGKSAEQEREAINSLINSRCDALIIHSHYLTDHQLMELFDGHSPTVLVNRKIPDIANQCVFISNRELSLYAVNHLQSHGHKEIALILPKRESFETLELHQGYKDGLALQGVIYNNNQVTESMPSVEGGYQATMALLDRHSFFSALLVCDERMAAGCLKALTERKIRVPGDISLIGIGSGYLSKALYPELSLIKHPIKKIGLKAARLALLLPGHDTKYEVTTFKPKLISGKTISTRK